MCSEQSGIAVVPYRPLTALERSDAWYRRLSDERRRLTVAAAQQHDADTLWRVTEAFVLRTGAAGASVSPHTLRAYQRGVIDLVTAWRHENLLHPAREAGQGWLRQLEAGGKKPATVRVRLAAGRALYAALAHAGATSDAPFTSAKPARDTTAPWDKRTPYTAAEVEALTRMAGIEERVLVLLGAHAGLRISEALALTSPDVTTGSEPSLIVRFGKGGKQRRVPVSPSLATAIATWQATHPGLPATQPLLRYRHALEARRCLERLACAAGVPYRGYHALRHACGTRLMRQTGDLEVVARVLGHSSIETTRIYAKWDDQRAAAAVATW